jgi:hypothetical protein
LTLLAEVGRQANQGGNHDLDEVHHEAEAKRDRCILMFSGGRDSTLAAVRLANAGYDLTLVTITSDHLFGIEAVKRRLAEMKNLLPGATEWLRIRQPSELQTDTSFYEQTCLPCHHAYVVVAGAVAASLDIANLAFGYATYQGTWPEQTPLATSRLGVVLDDLGIRLLLPVYDIASQSAAEDELRSIGLSALALEQKCSRQVTNVELPEDQLQSQISLWEKAIRESVGKLHLIETAILERLKIGEMAG